MRISACVITKNEEENLPSWLGCMQRIADEMVVLDTGSGDRTAEIARAAGAKVFFFQWMDDFAAAKNYALDRATGDWIFFWMRMNTFWRRIATKRMNWLEATTRIPMSWGLFSQG